MILYNRQLHQSERDWAKKNAHKFADYYAKETGKTISDEEAYQKLLSAGYAMVDDTASRTGGSDEKAKQFIGENKTAGLFDATPYERSQPLLGGNPDGSPTPEQQARTGTKNPTGVAQKLYGETLAASQKPCTDPYACGTKVDQVTAAVEALQQERALYQDDPAKRQQIEAQERQLLGGITSKEWQSAKLAQADASTLIEVLGVAGAPALVADISGALTRLGVNSGKSVGLPASRTGDALLPEADFVGRTPVRPADQGDLGQHLVEADVKISPKTGLATSISGGHNEQNFLDAVSSSGGKVVGDPVEIARGIKQYTYTMPGSGNSLLSKTVYDPTIFSNSAMVANANAAGQQAAYQFSLGVAFDLPKNNAYLIRVGGITWEVPVGNFRQPIPGGLTVSNPYIPTAYPHRTQ